MGAVIDLVEHAPDIYEPERDEKPGDELSPSQLTTFMGCPARWAFRKVWGVEEPPTVATAMGRAVHEATALAANVQIASGAILPTEDAIAAFRASWDQESTGVQFTVRHDPAELRERGSALVQKYMTELAPSIEPAAVEMALPTGAEVGGVRVRGRLDVIESNGRIRDTKTICRKPGAMLTAHRIQATIYAMAMPGASGLIAVDYLVKTKNKPQIVTFEDRVTHADELLATELLQRAQAGMRYGVYLPNRCADSCNRLMCGFADLCETEFGGRVPIYPEAS